MSISELKITTEHIQRQDKEIITIFHLRGWLDSQSESTLIAAAQEEFSQGIRYLVVNLEEIQIEKCKKIGDFEVLGKVKSLKKIILSESGEIKTLSFVKELNRIEFISFWGTNVLDGNINYCEGINYVGFDNKKHYTHKMEKL